MNLVLIVKINSNLMIYLTWVKNQIDLMEN
jgi:hypothetical protein